ncbi:AMP-binding protein [Nocardia sp. XZ_19_385]|uniref:AMP-binding protein n=1 Tax=Nocardia sp. XZ_19_385 TaxID=2769488 RepID=UPI00188F12A1|nr:AMP-binding protein [Nocardia sp. XZ_19_385]
MKTLSSDSVVSASDWVDLLATRARRSGDQTAYTFLDENGHQSGSLTYRELDRRARAIAAVLAEQFHSGDRALLLYPAGLDYVAAFFGCLYAQVIAVPLYEPGRGRSEQIEVIARDCAAAGVLTTREIATALPTFGDELSFARLPQVVTEEIAPAAESAAEPSAIDPKTIAYLQYTSGSTATPKGVIIDHAMSVRQCLEMACSWQIDADSVVTSWLPHFHDFGQVTGVLMPVFSGGRAVLMAPATFVKNPVRWLDAITKYHGTHSGAPNFAFDLCVDRTTPEQRAALDLSSWHLLSNGAEPVRKTTLERFEIAFAPCGLRETALSPGYGLAEDTLKVTCSTGEQRYLAERFDVTGLARRKAVPTAEPDGIDLVGHGTTVLDTEMAIVEPESGRQVSEGEVGEIWVQGPCVSPGYWGRPEETERTFGARIAGADDTPWLRTGDLGFVYAGELFLCGRLKNLMIVNGMNYYLEDIEATVVDSDDALRAGGVIAFAVTESGQEDLVLVAECRTDIDRELESLAASMHDAVAKRHGIAPATVVLVQPGAVPRTTSGKLRRQHCMTDFVAGRLPETQRWVRPAPVEPARTATNGNGRTAMRDLVRQGLFEQIRAWMAENKPDAPDLDPDRSLAEHGLGSVDQIDLHEWLESWAGKRFPPELIWDSETVTEMVRVLANILAPGGAR